MTETNRESIRQWKAGLLRKAMEHLSGEDLLWLCGVGTHTAAVAAGVRQEDSVVRLGTPVVRIEGCAVMVVRGVRNTQWCIRLSARLFRTNAKRRWCRCYMADNDLIQSQVRSTHS
jgi:hypothetical protein